jgi:small subunit ribosomal protein S11
MADKKDEKKEKAEDVKEVKEEKAEDVKEEKAKKVEEKAGAEGQTDKKPAKKDDKKGDKKDSKDSKDAKTEETAEAKPKKVKIKKRLVQEGKVYVQASYNNTIVTITEQNGDVIAWGSAGSSGFKGARKSTPYAAQIAAERTAEKAKLYGFERAHIYVKGVGSGREQAVRGLVSSGIELLSINDVTPMPHNGCRKKKPRRN